MTTIVLIFLVILLLFLEALTDGYTYLSWTTKESKYGVYYHISQVGLLLGYYLLGKVSPEIMSWGTLYLAGGYILMRFGIFDIFYNSITANTVQGTTSIFDKITGKFPILNHLLIRWLGFLIGVGLIVLI